MIRMYIGQVPSELFLCFIRTGTTVGLIVYLFVLVQHRYNKVPKNCPFQYPRGRGVKPVSGVAVTPVRNARGFWLIYSSVLPLVSDRAEVIRPVGTAIIPKPTIRTMTVNTLPPAVIG